MSRQMIIKYVERYKGLIDRGIERELERRLKEVGQISNELVKVVKAMRELSVGGKRLRGILTILGYELAVDKQSLSAGRSARSILAGGELGQIVQVAVMIELFHLGLLIQDDWMDRDGLRRGVATMQTRYGDSHTGNFMAMLAGDLTFGWGMEMMSGLKLEPELIKRGLGVWGRYFTRVGYGQMLDGLKVADEESLLQILALKSGEYSCVLPLQLGASLRGGDNELMEFLERYGMELGWVFQLRDDWLSEWGDSREMGKPTKNDRREGKKTLAIMYGRERLEQEIEKHVDRGKRLLSDLSVGRVDLRGQSLKVGVMEGLLEWMGKRDK